MLTSSSPMQALSPTTSLTGKSMTSDEIVDITNSRKLLRPTNEFGSLVLTPRKRALARKNNNNNNDTNNEPITSTPASSNGMVSPPLSSQKSIETLNSPQKALEDPIKINSVHEEETFDPEERITLFHFLKANIYSFEEMDNMEEKQGRLLGHGKFEVYQMHMKKVSYFQCGSVVYPILPRLKILKISHNQFILPLSNPERYWRIVIETNDSLIIKELEEVFKKICHFRNLYIQSTSELPITKPLPPPITTLPTSKSQASLSSITTAVACFALESDSSTFVEQISTESTPLPTQEQEETDEVESVVSSLDSALEDLTEDPKPFIQQEQLETSRYFTPSSSVQHTTLIDESRDTILLSPTFQHESSRILPKSRSSRSASLYIAESSWMDPTDDLITSSPGTDRYIKLNLNPNPRFLNKKKEKNLQKRIVTDPVMTNKSHRYSSYDVYNMLCDEDLDHQEKDAGFTGFLKSFWA
ncbi:unnamed protein product [Wickerhamomyces anomalus]